MRDILKNQILLQTIGIYIKFKIYVFKYHILVNELFKT